eukprot:520848-Hanusia_phi.AAC.3
MAISDAFCQALLKDVAVMSCARFPSWELDLEAPTQLLPAQYKYVVINLTNGEIVDREAGAPRWLGRPVGILQQEGIRNSKYVVSVRDEATTDRYRVLTKDVLETASEGLVSVYHFSLCAQGGGSANIHLYSGMGTGELEDIRLLVDFCDKVTGVFFVLKSNEICTGGAQLCATPSVDGYHCPCPCYLGRQSLPDLPLDGDSSKLAAKTNLDVLNFPVLREIQDAVKSMNEGTNDTVVDESCGSTLLEPLDYEKVMTTKLRLLRTVYEASGKRVVESEEFQDFVLDQVIPSPPILAGIKKIVCSSACSTDGELTLEKGTLRPKLRVRSLQMDALSSPGGNKYNACRYAAKKGVALIGDLPIGVCRNGVDIWSRPGASKQDNVFCCNSIVVELFRLDKRMGAPPDAFTELGQVGDREVDLRDSLPVLLRTGTSRPMTGTR